MPLTDGQKFREFVNNQGINDTDVAKKLGVSSEQVSNYYASKKFQRATLTKLQTAFTNFILNNIEANSAQIMALNPQNLGLGKGDGIPMYNFPASASIVQMYGDEHDIKIVGHLNIPGATKDSFALPIHGHSMYPTLENGSWGVVRPIEDMQDVDWGQIYYIEYGDYRVWKRLIKDEDNPDSVILCSDNETEKVNGRPKYASKTIKLGRIRKLCLLTDILKKPNY